MLPSRHKLSSSDEFRRTIRKGKRAGRSTVVIHLRTHVTAGEIAAVGGPRFGLVVSKAVGNAVTRHAVSRKLRHVLMGIKDQIPQDAHIVVRALPPAATATSKELESDVRSGVEKLLLR
ncbi:ribonuclease P protein component [Corynebacterium pseudotuberculosis]|uniref:ribonuclease P protein component n=1 Tax=Corynebacterium pseudotuberculosis TaxID=1719 RepID=UPI0007192F01|nr:ribonuclease P protein component [Corynebacterium pseudotuberculosis]ALP34796.1 Ribonuclease P protein component [Corynebacterium pseudotuberculosis]ALR34674.1 ribonuclease P protein component [Corynebacterium pseudotuberculosis]APX35257.1 ribonuclease P protein component [Corynebacterium pseudotuberculosis]APX37098.1 ribonuclease P protein component [Corynebacterium pseudotuberculosis]AQL52219.1 Ribonuclease P protein component [Corynebacterium pseudotuberculosis]